MVIKKIFKRKKIAATKKIATKQKGIAKKKVPVRKKVAAPKKKATSLKKKAKALSVQRPSTSPSKRIKIVIPPGRILTAEGWSRRD
ncbi:MAG: hypothetical protein QNJ27_00210 [Simkaniaceae bacterium]|nr:hypothetical protein [Simkaniaceae bacterium]